MDNKNIILFSSGVTEENGILIHLKEALEKLGYRCAYWRDLFKYAKDPSNIALLPSLIKKIPTFDYAILICEGHDKTTMLREGRKIVVDSMRDNVLFEIGLCSMALGLSRTILLTDSHVHLPEDLSGKNGSIAIKRFIYAKDDTADMSEKAEAVASYIRGIEDSARAIDRYISESGNVLTPVIIGAASSSAEGYANNFILRTLEHLEDGVIVNEKMYRFSLDKVFVHIMIPDTITEDTASIAEQKLAKYEKGSVPTARSRSAVFRCEITGDELHIYDFPTSMITSYNTARMILNMDADDSADLEAASRFTAKELKLFEATLKSLLSKEYVVQVINGYYSGRSEAEREHLIRKLCELFQTRFFVEHPEHSLHAES